MNIRGGWDYRDLFTAKGNGALGDTGWRVYRYMNGTRIGILANVIYVLKRK